MFIGFYGIKIVVIFCFNFLTYDFFERFRFAMKFLIFIISVLSIHVLLAQSTEITLVYTNNTNGNLENCV